MKDLILQYIHYINSKKFSKNTLDAYTRDINRFYDFIKDRKENLNSIDRISIMSYAQKLKKDGRANSSIVRNLISIRNFYKFLIKNKYVEEDPTLYYEIPKIKRNVPQILTVEEVDKLLSTPDLSTNKGIRDKAMLELLYATGMKITELLNLKIFDLDLKLSYVRCKGTKDKERIIPVGSYAVECMKEYLKIRNITNHLSSDNIFFNSQGTRMTRQGFWKIIKQYAKETKINKDINSYTLRHSFAVHLLQNGADIKSVGELLGHKDLAATQRYSVITKKNKLAEVYKNAHPRA